MTPNDIILAVRMAPEIKDMDAAHYSDYDILQALNETAAYIYSILAEQTSSLLDKRVELQRAGTDDGYLLPDDFLQLVNAYDADGRVMRARAKGQDLTEHTYRIVGSKLYTKSKTVTMDYKPFFVELTMDDLEQEMDLPPFFKNLVKKAVVLLMQAGSQQDTDVLQLISDCVLKLVGNMAYSQIPDAHSWAEVV
ncbi:hypothetical protein [Mitsuokella multacida]|uniref:hypothetical protein n=1 Tax=Mitsuokella multacida TaxID=52226 RepID=UPI00266544E0|nr:hypothetical protein [Mitsuokella multacida]